MEPPTGTQVLELRSFKGSEQFERYCGGRNSVSSKSALFEIFYAKMEVDPSSISILELGICVGNLRYMYSYNFCPCYLQFYFTVSNTASSRTL